MESKVEQMHRLARLKDNLDEQMKDWLRDVNSLLGTNFVTPVGAGTELNKQIGLARDYS